MDDGYGDIMIIRRIKTGGDRNFAYIIADKIGGEAALIDPSFSPDRVLEEARNLDFSIRYVLNTHDHPDHSNGNDYFFKEIGVSALSFGKTDKKSGQVIEDGTVLPLDKLSIKVIHTPGHTDDSVCYFFVNTVFTGDTLFVGKVGGTDFEEGAKKQYASLHNKLLKLPENTKVCPGHDVGVSPVSTIGDEKRENPFLLRESFEEFVDLKKNWLEYKEEHGID